ncbi:MAG: cyclase family protein [bacterium]
MKLTIDIAGKSYLVDWAHPIDLSIPLQFSGDQPCFFHAPPASVQPYTAGNFTGDTRQGGSCNVEEYRLIPHCNGTHTECVGHIARERISLHTTLKQAFIPAILLSLESRLAADIDESYSPAIEPDDMLITADCLQKTLRSYNPAFLEALIIRTIPNDSNKISRNYSKEPAPFFSLEAISLIRNIGIEHLLVDLPSLDRADDNGEMSAHHIFWDVTQGSHEVDPQNHTLKTITEMIYVPEHISDGIYLLNLQIPAFVADAAPSRPVILPLQEAG